MTKVVLFQHPKSRYGVLANMTESLRAAFVRQGVDAVLFEWWKGDPDDLEKVIKAENPDFTFSINIFIDETYFYMPFGIPHVYLSVDAFTYCHQALPIMPHLVTLFVDGSSKDLFAARSSNPVYWFPHGIAKETLEERRLHPWIPFHERPYDVVFLGSYIDHERERDMWNNLFSAADVNQLVSCAQSALEDPSYPFLSETLSLIETTPSIRLPLEANTILASQLVNSVERYVRGLDRERLLSTFTGRTVHIFSAKEEWKEVRSNYVFHEPVSFDQVCDVCAHARVVLNSVPTIRRGYHERLFLGLAAGATVVTSHVNLPSWLMTSGAIVSYRTSTLSGLQARLAEHEGRQSREEILNWLDKEHTWDVRIKEVLPGIVDSVKGIRDTWNANPFWKLTV